MDEAWRHIFQYFTILERIRYERVSARWMKLLREYWKQFDTVDTDRLCIDVRLIHWSSCVQAILARCSPNITSFNFGCYHEGNHRKNIKKPLLPDVLMELVKKAPSLRSFRVEDCFLYMESINLLKKLSPTLKVFCLERCIIDHKNPQFVTSCFLSLLDNCSTLEEFVIKDTYSEYACMYINDDFMEHISSTVSILCISAGKALQIRNASFISKLKKLRLFEARQSLLSLKLFQDLIHNAPDLLYLDLSNSSDIKDFSLIGKLSKLRCLLLNDNHIYLHLNAIIKGCISLEVLSLKRCSKLSDEDFKAISECSTLKELHLTCITGMTDDILIYIAFGVPLLEVLDISYCKSLTSKGLQYLAMLKKLNHLCVNGIYDFDDYLINMIHKCRPYCIIEAYHCRYTMSTNELFQIYRILAYGCTPFDYDTIAQNMGLRSHYAFGENTLQSQPITISNEMESGQIDESSDLFCYDFNSNCRWHNLNSMMINDDLKWFHGSGPLDRNRLQVSTGTYVTPDGNYGIVATDQIRSPNSKATLVSDVITCQLGPGELQFMYWISPEVRLTVCLKRTSQPYPNFDFCTNPIRGGSPGPAKISIADLGNQPFQILIQADNFIFHSANLEGGFAIIDNLEYYGDLCSGVTAFPTNEDFIISQTMHDENEPTESIDTKSTFEVYKSVCDVLQCTFNGNDDQCGINIPNSTWLVAHADIDKIQIDKNISNFPLLYRPAISFIYIVGPITKARLYTASFQSTDNFNFIFAYYKTSNNPKLRVIVKMREALVEKIIFTTPVQRKQTNRWYRELTSLQAGIYEYVSPPLASNMIVQISEITLPRENQEKQISI